MNTNEQEENIARINHLIAENESLKEQLREYKHIIGARDREINILATEAEEATILRSDLDNKLDQLQFLQNHIGKLQQQAEGAAGRETELEMYINEGVSVEHQLADLKQQYTYLKTQLNDLQYQLQEVTNRNLILQQHAGRIAELESLLLNAEDERDEWKAKALELEKK